MSAESPKFVLGVVAGRQGNILEFAYDLSSPSDVSSDVGCKSEFEMWWLGYCTLVQGSYHVGMKEFGALVGASYVGKCPCRTLWAFISIACHLRECRALSGVLSPSVLPTGPCPIRPGHACRCWLALFSCLQLSKDRICPDYAPQSQAPGGAMATALMLSVWPGGGGSVTSLHVQKPKSASGFGARSAACTRHCSCCHTGCCKKIRPKIHWNLLCYEGSHVHGPALRNMRSLPVSATIRWSSRAIACRATLDTVPSPFAFVRESFRPRKRPWIRS